jgi:hypothetical protein
MTIQYAIIAILSIVGAVTILRKLNAILLNSSNASVINLRTVARNGMYYVQVWSWLRWRDIRGADINKWLGSREHHPKADVPCCLEYHAKKLIDDIGEKVIARNTREVERTLSSTVIDIAQKRISHKDEREES